MKIKTHWSRDTEGFTVFPALYYGRGVESSWLYLSFLFGRIGIIWGRA